MSRDLLLSRRLIDEDETLAEYLGQGAVLCGAERGCPWQCLQQEYPLSSRRIPPGGKRDCDRHSFQPARLLCHEQDAQPACAASHVEPAPSVLFLQISSEIIVSDLLELSRRIDKIKTNKGIRESHIRVTAKTQQQHQHPRDWKFQKAMQP